ncbi:MAG: competence/damage-inducible protein A [Bacteroidota bacterium]|nr:competence/damage-inducible protein A [Bacteroidota bacterium]
MQAELLSIGDELLIGQIVNSNAAYISRKLNEMGIEVSRVTTIGDNEEEILEAMKTAWQHNDIVIATGGLGPTHDDISKNVVAKFFKKRLLLDLKTLAHVRARFRSFGISKMPEINIGQAMVPQGFKALRNDTGTAPGLLFHQRQQTFIILPGVPHEMTFLMEKWVIPGLRTFYRKKLGSAILHRTLLTVGIGESTLAARIGNVHDFLDAGATLAFLPKTSGVRVRISVRAESATKAKSKVARIEKHIRDRAGNYIYGTDSDTLEGMLFQLLKKRKATLSVAESCTGGMLSMRMTNIPGSSEVFAGGIISYSNSVKIKELGISKKLIDSFGAVSKECALAMAEGACKKFGTTFSLAITGIAGPGGGTKDKPVGTIWIALAEAGHPTLARSYKFAGDRSIIRERSADSAMEMLRRRLL